MGNIFSGAPTNTHTIPRESSPLVPSRDPTGPAANWRHVAKAQEQNAALTSLMGVVNREFAKSKDAADQAYGMHPFKLYSLPANVREALGGGFSPDDWRKVRVRMGLLFVNGYGQIVTTGSDNAAIWPTGTDFPADDTANFYQTPFGNTLSTSGVVPGVDLEADFDVPLVDYGSRVWFWLSLIDGNPLSAEIIMSATPADDGWFNFPEPNPYIIPIGFVSFTTYWLSTWGVAPGLDTTVNVLDFHQILTSDVVLDSPRQMTYYGDIEVDAFDGNGYPEGAVVEMASPNVSGKTNSYVSLEWFNLDDPGSGPGLTSWKCIGQRPTTNP